MDFVTRDRAHVGFKYYSLCVEILKVSTGYAVDVAASIPVMALQKHDPIGEFSTNNVKSGTKLVVIEDFIPESQWDIDTNGVWNLQRSDYDHWQNKLFYEDKISVTLKATLFTLCQDNDAKNYANSIPGIPSISKQCDAETSLLSDLRTLALSDENYADLKLETKDHMTLNAHKFFLVARSPVFKNIVDEAAKREDFNGTIKVADVDAKPMMVVLHWVYTGKLRKNAANCLGQVVDASIKYKLNGLLEILDKKLITICNTENMFDLIQTAKKCGILTAVKDISDYIKENL